MPRKAGKQGIIKRKKNSKMYSFHCSVELHTEFHFRPKTQLCFCVSYCHLYIQTQNGNIDASQRQHSRIRCLALRRSAIGDLPFAEKSHARARTDGIYNIIIIIGEWEQANLVVYTTRSSTIYILEECLAFLASGSDPTCRVSIIYTTWPKSHAYHGVPRLEKS